MKRSSLYVLAAALIAAFAIALLPTQQPVSADEHGDKADSQKVIHEAMEELASHYRQVRRGMRDADKNAETAGLLAEMIQKSVEAKAHLPQTASTDDLKTSYRVTMNKLIIALANAENAALTGDQDKLRDYVLEANTVKGEGHELFIPEDE